MNKIISTLVAILCFTVNALAQEETAARTVRPALLQDLNINADINIASVTINDSVKITEVVES